MQILVNSDNHVSSGEAVSERVETIVEGSVQRFADRLTRVEVHLSDTNGDKHGARDKRCMMEARLAGFAPIAVTHEAPAMIEAIDGAAEKLERALEHAVGRIKALHTASREDLNREGLDREELNREDREVH
jgi:ribosome-associated translation inhibitor RaiA